MRFFNFCSAKAKAVKLKAYYQKLCDEEEKSMKRNQQLLVDMQRIDSQFLQLDSKLERLTNLKVILIIKKIVSFLLLIFNTERMWGLFKNCISFMDRRKKDFFSKRS